jgi:hypothetical protein
MLTHKAFSRSLRDPRAVARYVGMTDSPDESGARRREKGLARAGNARVRRGMIQLAWRFLMFQKDSALAQWYRARTADARGATRKALIIAGTMRTLLTTESVASASWVNKGLIFGGGFSLEPPLIMRRPVRVFTVCGLTMVSQCFQIGRSTSAAVRTVARSFPIH